MSVVHGAKKMTITLDVPSTIGTLIEADGESRRRASAVLVAMFSGMVEPLPEPEAVKALQESFEEDAGGKSGMLLEDFRSELATRWKK